MVTAIWLWMSGAIVRKGYSGDMFQELCVHRNEVICLRQEKGGGGGWVGIYLWLCTVFEVLCCETGCRSCKPTTEISAIPSL